MRRWQKIFFVLILLALLSQLPFAYRRRRLVRLDAAIQQLKSQRVNTDDALYAEYKGVSHVHSFLGGHSGGNFQEIINAAQANQLDFVVMTEHTERDVNTAAMTLKGVQGGVLFLNGNEVSVSNAGRVLLVPGLESQAQLNLPLETLTSQVRAKEGLTIVAYPQEFAGWSTTAYDAVEIYNVYTNARGINPVAMFFDGLWSYRHYPEFLFANFYTRPNEAMKLWDQALARGQRITGLAGNDAHANVGFGLYDASGKAIFSLQLDPYERSFRLVRIHVLLPRAQVLNMETLLLALHQGHCFIGFDLLSDTTGFRFTAKTNNGERIQGDELAFQAGIHLQVQIPLPGRIVLLRNGQQIQVENGKTKAEFAVGEPGTYRSEVYLTQLPHPVGEQPWIISNPIYVR